VHFATFVKFVEFQAAVRKRRYFQRTSLALGQCWKAPFASQAFWYSVHSAFEMNRKEIENQIWKILYKHLRIKDS